jgi:uncharacterized iron-regulated protein
MSTPITGPSLSDLVNAAESALNAYSNDQTTIAADQAKVTSAQNQLAADQATTQTDGATAYQAVGAAITALQAVQDTLPQPGTPPASS